MPKGIGRPFNKDLNTIKNSKLYKGSGIAGEASKAKEEQRNFGARADFNEMRARESSTNTKTIPLKTGPENPPDKTKEPFRRRDNFDPDWKRHVKGK